MLTAAVRPGLFGALAAAIYALFGNQRAESVSAAAERLLRAHGDSVLRCAYAYLRNRSDAEDVVQDTFLAYLRAAPSLDGPEHEKAWLLRVAANISKNRLKYNSRRRTDELAEGLAAEEREDLSFVWEAVKSLPVKQRECVHLYYAEGFSTAEIAEILGRSESSVRSNLTRGRERLREILREAYDFEIR